MASNSPGSCLGSAVFNENQEFPVLCGLQADAGCTPGKFHLTATTGFQRDSSLMVRDSGYMSTSDGASTCSSSTAEMCDLEGGTLLLLEPKSLRSFITNDEYLFAMKEDLADWFSNLYQNYEINADSFFTVLETGVLLCKHANKVQEVAKQRREMGETLEMRSYFIRSVPEGNIPYREGVRPETFQARDNISNFISWTKLLGIPEVLSFETDDLVLRKNEKSVILCLLEVARVGAKLGMLAPILVQMEEEIDAELAGQEPQPRVQIQTCDLRSLDERVRDLISRCTCPIQFPMVKVSDGKYKIGNTKNLIFVRILRNHVMVRVGGGWDTLENYLNKHDPCQCNYRGKGHRASVVGVTHTVSQQHRSSHPGNNAFQTPNTPLPQRIASSVVNTSKNLSPSPQNSSRSSSPNLVISRNMPTSSKSHASSNSASKGVHMIPSENQQEQISGTWSSQPSKSGDHIRSSSPSQSRLRTASPLTVLHQTTPSDSAAHRISSSADLTREIIQESTVKTIKPNNNAVPSVNRSASLAEHDNMTTQTSHLRGAFELISDKTSSVEFSSAGDLPNEQQHNISAQNSRMLAEHLKTFGHNPAEVFIRNSGSGKDLPGQEMTSKVTVKLNDVDNVSDSEIGVERKMRRNSLPHISGITHGLSSVAVTSKQKNNRVFKSNEDKAKDPIVSHSKLQPSTQRTANPQFAQNMSPTLCKTKGNKMLSEKLLKDASKDSMFQATSANFEWPESTNEDHLTEIRSSIPQKHSQSKTVADSFSYVAQSSANNVTAEDDHMISPQKDTLGSTARERPPSMSRIPKPRYTSRPSTPRTPVASGSRYDCKDNAGLQNLISQKNVHQGNVHQGNVQQGNAGNKALASSQSDNSLSSVKSSDEIPLLSNSNFCNDSLTPVKSVVHNSNMSDHLDSINRDSADHRSTKVASEQVVEAFDKNPEKLIELNEKPPEDCSGFSVLRNTDSPDTNRKFSGITALASPEDVLNPASPNATNLEKQQDMIINDITFSDDEEVNELIKNLALKKKEDAKNVQSKVPWTKKYVLQKSKRNEEVVMISRNSTGHHAVQHDTKHQPTSGPKTVHRTQARVNSKHILETENDRTKSSPKTDGVMFENNVNLSVESKDLHEKNAAVCTSVLENISFSRTEAWVDSTLPGNKRKPLPSGIQEPRGNEFLPSNVS